VGVVVVVKVAVVVAVVVAVDVAVVVTVVHSHPANVPSSNDRTASERERAYAEHCSVVRAVTKPPKGTTHPSSTPLSAGVPAGMSYSALTAVSASWSRARAAASPVLDARTPVVLPGPPAHPTLSGIAGAPPSHA
jgi:hypothetical protein